MAIPSLTLVNTFAQSLVNPINTLKEQATSSAANPKIGITYLNLLSKANEGNITDAFQIVAPVNGTLWVNIGSTVPGSETFKQISFVTTPDTTDFEMVGADPATGNILLIRLAGVHLNNVLLGSTDPKIYWQPNAGFNGDVNAFTVRAVDAINGTTDLSWAGSVDVSTTDVMVKINVAGNQSILFFGGGF